MLEQTALSLGELIRSGEVSSEEVTRAYLDRIARYDPQINAFASVLWRRAIASARKKDQQRRNARAHLDTFHGVPIGIKDLVPMLGTRTRLGSRAYKHFVSPFDAPLARRVKQAGLVVLGKLSTSEFGAMPVTEPDVHAPTRNPFDQRHTSGGSSGGSGAAMAAGLVPIAHGSDGAGSVRIPSAFCHVYGFKPSLGLLGNLHGRVNKLGMSVMGPLAHTVDDAAAMLDVFAGRSPTDPGGCLQACRQPQPGLRVRVSTKAPIGTVDSEIEAAVTSTAKVLEELGHHVEEAPVIAGSLDEFLPLWFFMLAAVPSPGERYLQPVTQWLRRNGRGLRVESIRELKADIARRVADVFGDADVLLTPTVGRTPPKVGEFRGLDPESAFRGVAPLGAFTAVFNISDQPAASIPAGIHSDGLPYGVQIVGRPDADRLVLALSREIETAMPWRSRRASMRNLD